MAFRKLFCKKEVARLEADIEALRRGQQWHQDLSEQRRAIINRHCDTIDKLQAEIDEYERHKPEDINALFAIILDYRRILDRLAAPDPIIMRGDVQDLFDKYRVEL